MRDATKPRSFKEIHASVQKAMRTAKGWKEFDEMGARREQMQLLESLMFERQCIDVMNTTRGFTDCDCLNHAAASLTPLETVSFGEAMYGMLKKPRKEIDQNVIEWINYANARRHDLIGRPRHEQQRVYLLPGAWKHRVCKNAIASLCGYGRKGWERVTKAAKEGILPQHGLAGQTSNRLKRYDHGPMLHAFFARVEQMAAPRATRVVRCFTTEGSLQNGLREDDENVVELPTTFTKNALYLRFCREECGTDIQFDGKHKVMSKEPVEGKEQLPVPAWSTFRLFWNENYPHLHIQKPREDVCGECFKFANSFRTIAFRKRQLEEVDTASEEENDTNQDDLTEYNEAKRRMIESEKAIEVASEHVQMAKEQRDKFIEQKNSARATKDKPKGERVVTFVCDYSQNLYLPNFGSEQPGETYYYSPLNVYVFGMVDCSVNKLQAHVYLEGEGKKGGNNVASMVWWQLQHQGLLIPFDQELPSSWIPLKELNLWFDNCGGQNKNRMVIRLLPILLRRKVARRINFNFLIAGHTKNDCDRMFNLMRMRYRKANCYVPDQILDVLCKQKDVIVQRMDASVFLDFATAQDAVMLAVAGVNSCHCFTCTEADPQAILLKPFYNCSEEQCSAIENIIKKQFKDDDWISTFVTRLAQLHPPGLQSIKLIELHDKWAKLIPEEHRARFKLYNEDPGLEVRSAVKKQKKQAKEQRSGRHRQKEPPAAS